MGGGLESRCVGRVYSADGAVRLSHGTGISNCFKFFKIEHLSQLSLIHAFLINICMLTESAFRLFL